MITPFWWNRILHTCFRTIGLSIATTLLCCFFMIFIPQTSANSSISLYFLSSIFESAPLSTPLTANFPSLADYSSLITECSSLQATERSKSPLFLWIFVFILGNCSGELVDYYAMWGRENGWERVEIIFLTLKRHKKGEF